MLSLKSVTEPDYRACVREPLHAALRDGPLDKSSGTSIRYLSEESLALVLGDQPEPPEEVIAELNAA